MDNSPSSPEPCLSTTEASVENKAVITAPGEILDEAPQAGQLPSWILKSRKKLHQFEKYVCKSYHLPCLLSQVTDSRRGPMIPTFDVVNSLLHAALLRIPSLNALEGDLKEPDFQKLLGHQVNTGKKVFSAEVVSNVLDKVDLKSLTHVLHQILWKAERNKAFREGSYGALRCVAVDGWELFSSFHRHCCDCLERQIKVKDKSGELVGVTQYYHRYVVALLIGPQLDVVLGIEPIRNLTARMEAGEAQATGPEGELSAAARLIDSLHQTYGTFIDAFVLDSLYPNGPIFTQLDRLGYGAFVVVKKKDNEPLKEALALWHRQPPCLQVDDPNTGEHIDFWEIDDLETLDTYSGKIRVVRAHVSRTKPREKHRTWCVAIIGSSARRLSLPTTLKITRARWHVENTAFHQWTCHWHLDHVFRHTPNAIRVVLLLWSIAFNLLQLFLYRRLKRARRPHDPSDTIRHLVEVMLRDLATFPVPFPWLALFDSS